MDSGQWNGNGGYCCAILYDHGSTVAQRSMGIIDSPPSTNLESLPKLESRCVSVVGPFLHGETFFGLKFNHKLHFKYKKREKRWVLKWLMNQDSHKLGHKIWVMELYS